MPYPLWQRVRDRWQGWCDGRKGVPLVVHDVPDDAGSPVVATPKLEELRRLARELIEGERIGMDVDCAAHTERRMRLQGAVHSATEAAEHARERLDQLAKLGTDDELQRRSVELDRADRSDDLIRRRRRAEHHGRVERAMSAYESAVRRLDDLLADIAVLDNAMRMRRLVGAARARRIHEHGWRRAAVYWQRLVIAHQHGPRLNAVLRPAGPDLPSWAREDTSESEDKDGASIDG